MMKKHKIILTLFGVLLLIIYLTFFHKATVSNIAHNNMCKAKKKALSTEFSGILIEKFEDKNDHLIRKLRIRTKNGVIKSSFLATEVSGFYNKILSGDSIVKKDNTLEIIVLREGEKEVYILDYACH